MNRPTNAALKVAGIALVLTGLGGALTGCSGSDSAGGSAGDSPSGSPSDSASDSDTAASAPKDGTADGFCEQFNGLYANLAGLSSEDASGAIKGLKDWAAGIEDYGPPSELSDEERSGFKVVIATFKDVDDDATAEELQAIGSDMSAEENKAAAAFSKWTTDNCPAPEAPEAPAVPEAPDVPSEEAP